MQNLSGAVDALARSVEFRKYRPDQARDTHGRFATEGATTEQVNRVERTLVLPRHGDDVRSPIRDFARRALAVLHQHAGRLAQRAKKTISSTRFAGASPLQTGGIEIRATHALPTDGQGHLKSYLQVHPSALGQNAAALKLLNIAHSGLIVTGHKLQPAKHPPFAVTFANGDAS